MKATPLLLSAAMFAAAALSAPAATAQVFEEDDISAEELAALGVERIRRVVVFGNDPCPQSSATEIVVCARRSDNERYRIPEQFRGETDLADNVSWAARARQLEYVGETGIQSCSTSGPAGHTGCWAEMMRQWREERAAAEQPIP